MSKSLWEAILKQNPFMPLLVGSLFMFVLFGIWDILNLPFWMVPFVPILALGWTVWFMEAVDYWAWK